MATKAKKSSHTRGTEAKKGTSRTAPRRDGSRSGGRRGGGRITARNVTRDEARFLERHQDELSPTTLRAKWVHAADEHEDRPGQSLATRSHEVIQHWAEERGAAPATVPTQAAKAERGRPRVLRFDFPGYGGRKLEAIDWDAWFQTFDRRKLVFLFQEHKRDGQESNFFRFDSPEREHD
ncbi:MAG TPA: hypothetical protein VJ739_04065 [Gemmataceae bacterium]|nr:hypothetical protein [Gemmataceae bacterium]